MGKYQVASDRTIRGVTRNFMDDWVYVSKSKFLKSSGHFGYGLYSNTEYAPGDVILEYLGKHISDASANAKRRYTQYLFDVTHKHKVAFVIDAANNKYASAAKFANSTLTFNDNKRNAEFFQYKQRVYLVASKHIRKNKEIITYYGPDTINVIHAQ
jgi:SET domain-containing protein